MSELLRLHRSLDHVTLLLAERDETIERMNNQAFEMNRELQQTRATRDAAQAAATREYNRRIEGDLRLETLCRQMAEYLNDLRHLRVAVKGLLDSQGSEHERLHRLSVTSIMNGLPPQV